MFLNLRQRGGGGGGGGAAAAAAAAARRVKRASEEAALGTATGNGSLGKILVLPPSSRDPKDSKWIV